MDFKERIIGQLDGDLILRIVNLLEEEGSMEIIELEDGTLEHIVVKGTKTPVGYVGNDNLIVLGEPSDSHKKLEDIYKQAERMMRYIS